MGEMNDKATIDLLKKNTQRIQDSKQKNDISKTEHLLAELFEKIQKQKLIIQHLQNTVDKTEDKRALDELHLKIKEESVALSQLMNSLMQLSVGSIDLNELEGSEVEEVSLNKSIEDIFEPFAIMLMRFTQKPRKIEHLNLEIDTIKLQTQKLNSAIGNLKAFKTLSPELQLHVNEKIDYYSQKKLLLLHKLDALTLQLNKIQVVNDKPLDQAIETFYDIFNSHGLTLLYALFGFLITLSVFSLVKRMMNLYFKSKNSLTHQLFSQRVLNLLVDISTFIIASLVAIFVIYTRSDWLILAIILFILFTLFWSLKSTLPKYITEMKLMLNIGVVREDERVVYQGVPYLVESIGLYPLLNNPILSNGRVRVSLNILEQLTSRVISQEEEWFPTKEGEYVFVDKSYGQVLFQSPELVTLKTFGTALKSYSTKEFLKLKPTNISRSGFSIIITISLDYKHQKEITGSVRTMMEKGLNRAITHEKFYRYMEKTWVEFNEAKIHSLDLKIISVYKGAAAADYYHIERTLRRSVVEICNNNGWKLPYPQMEIRSSSSLLLNDG